MITMKYMIIIDIDENGNVAPYLIDATTNIKVLEQESCDDIKEIREVMSCDANAETKCKMISNILTAKPHYFKEKEPCDDAISRQAVLKQLKGCLTGGETEYNYVKMHIDNIPHVTPQPKWISCSEKSPDKNERIALLYDNGLVSGGKYLGNKTYDVDFPDQNKRTRIVAWIPIQSYKVES